MIATSPTPSLKTPRHPLPKTAVVTVAAPPGAARARVSLQVAEITQANNIQSLR